MEVERQLSDINIFKFNQKSIQDLVETCNKMFRESKRRRLIEEQNF